MKSEWRNPFFIFGIILVWRVLLLIFTTQPIPANDAFFFDGAMVNWILHGHYFNRSLSQVFAISGHQIYAAYPPGYQIVLLPWMLIFGTSVVSSIGLHLALFAISGFLVLKIVRQFFPESPDYALAALLFLGITFDDRPESLAHVFGLAALLFLTKKIYGNEKWKITIAISLCLFAALYTSIIVGAFYFGAGFVAAAIASRSQRKLFSMAPFLIAAILFAGITFAIAKLEPLWWAGFRENARQTPVLALGFRSPDLTELLKLIRTAPIFLLALIFLPVVIARRKQIFFENKPWLFLAAGIFVAGWILLVADMTLLAATYVNYILFVQIILAAGLFALAENFFSKWNRILRCLIFCSVLLISIRAIGMTTWGIACAWKNSYAATQKTLRMEFQPFEKSDSPIIISSPFLYEALKVNVRNPIHSDWYFDRAISTATDSEVNALEKLRPPKLVLTQFDYYRSFVSVFAKLREHPELVEIRVRDFAHVRTPDSIPKMQRVVQHISWAPVVVDLYWKK